jgi:hypothetical protein
MATKTRKQLVDEISDLCDQHGCNDKIHKVHTAQYVDRGWNPHPPQHFANWWGSVGKEMTEKKSENSWQDIDSIRAFNCETVREVYREAKQFGLSHPRTTEYSD